MNFYDMFGNFKPVTNNYSLENFASSDTCIINPSDGETCGDLITQIERLKTMVSTGKISDNVQLTNFVDKIRELVTSDQEIVAFNSLLQTNVQNMSGMSLGGNLAISGVMKAKKYYLSDGTTVKSIIEPEMAVPLDKNGNVILKTNSFVSIESRNPKVILKSNNSDTIDEDDIGNKIAISIDENVPNKLIINQNKNFTNGTQFEGKLKVNGNSIFDTIKPKEIKMDQSKNPKIIMKSKNQQIDSENDDGIVLSVKEDKPNKLIINEKNSFSEGTHIEGDLTITGKLNVSDDMSNKQHNKIISNKIIIRSTNIVEEESSNPGRAMMVQDDKIDTLRINFNEDFKDGTHIDGKLKVSNSIKTKELTLSDTITDSDKFYFQNVGISDNTKKLFKYTDPVSNYYTFFRTTDDVVSVYGVSGMYSVESAGVPPSPTLVDFKLLKSDGEYTNMSNKEFVDKCFTLLEEFNDVVKCFVISYTDNSKTVISSVLFKEQIKNIQQNKNFMQLYVFKNNLETAKSKINRSESLYKNAFKFFISNENNLSIKINKGNVEETINMESVIENVSSMQNIINNILPSGSIIIWSGSINEIPSGFAFCDGTNRTPDLRGRFIVCYDPGDEDYNEIDKIGGFKTVTLENKHMPSHNHSGSAVESDSHDHEGTVTSNNGSHTHGIKTKQDDYNVSGGSGPSFGRDNGRYDVYHNTESGGGHTHRITLNSSGNHSHDFTTSYTGGVEVTNGNFVTQAHENRPPYFTLAYIMKKYP